MSLDVLQRNKNENKISNKMIFIFMKKYSSIEKIKEKKSWGG